MKKIAVLFQSLAIALMGLAGIGVSTVFAAGSATMTLSPTNVSVDSGETFTLSVVVDPNGASLDTVRLNIGYDSDAIEALSYDNGSLFPFLSPANEIDNNSDGVGELSYGAFKFGSPVSSSGVVGTVTFRALKGGSHTISVNNDSKLIADGDEQLNTSALGSTAVSVSGGESAKTDLADTPTADVTTGGETEEDATDEENALAYFTALTGRLPASQPDWDMHQCIIDDSCLDLNARDLDYENAALVYFVGVYGENPSEAMDWNAVHALAYTSVGQDLLGLDPLSTDTSSDDTSDSTTTETPAAEEEAAEEEAAEEEEKDYSEMTDQEKEESALKYFGAFYGRMPASGDDWDALHCMAYGGCQGDPRDVDAEAAALETYGAKYGTMPSTTIEWNTLHVLAYTDLLQVGEEADATEEAAPAEEETPAAEEPAAEEPAAEEESGDKDYSEMTDQEKEAAALKYFGAFYGRMPSSSNDWDALHCMAYGGCQGDPRDVDAEAAALETYGAKYGTMPSTTIEWNTLHVLAYTDLLQVGEEAPAEEEVPAEEEEAPAEEEPAAEEESSDELTEEDAIGLYGKIYGELPGDGNDGWTFVDIAVNGYSGERDLDAEAAALETYTATFNALPSSDSDWRVMDAIAYSSAS